MPIDFLIKTACFQSFQQEIYGQNCPETTNDYFIVSFPAHGEGKGRLYIVLETADAKQLFDIYLNH